MFITLVFSECLSVLKNMVLCGLPVPKKVEGWLRDFLANMTSELPEDSSINDKMSETDNNSSELNKMEGGGVHHAG